MKLPLFIHITVIILSPWWWIIVGRNLWVSILAFILSVAVFIYFWQVKSKKLFLSLLLLTTILFFVAVKDAFDESIFRNSALDIQQINKRHEFYASMGKLYKNRFSLAYFGDYNLPFSKLQRNFFANLDPNLYFFTSHPRERMGVEEFKKYLPIFLPFFLIGIIYSIYLLSPNIFIYLILISLMSSIISSKYNLGPVLFFPLINYMITIGFILSIKGIRRYLKKEI